MAVRLTETQMLDLLRPYLPGRAPAALATQLVLYLDVLLRWNAKLNLTAIRDPAMIVQRHFGESLFAAGKLPGTGTLLDLGSGAGFPGIPIKLLHSELEVTLVEAQTRKAAFLQEVGRVLGVDFRVWARRAEELPLDGRFHTVTLRAVDEMPGAVRMAGALAGERLCILCGGNRESLIEVAPAFDFTETPVPNSASRVLLLGQRRGLLRTS